MVRLLELFCVVENDENDSFRPAHAVVMLLLILSFLAASMYVLFSSFNS